MSMRVCSINMCEAYQQQLIKLSENFGLIFM